MVMYGALLRYQAHQDNTSRINRGIGYDNQRAVNVAGARENVEHPVQPESVKDTYLVEHGDSIITIDSLDMSTNGEMVDQDDDDDLAKERDLLASLIDKLKCEIDDNKNCNKLLESSNKTLVDKLKGEIKDFKTKNKSLESSNNHFKEANNELSKTNQLMFKDHKKFQAKLDRYHDVNYASKMEIDCAKAKGDLVSYKMESQKSLNENTRKINDFKNEKGAYQVVKCERLEKELSKSHTTSKSFEALQQHAINLELSLQQCQEQIKMTKLSKKIRVIPTTSVSRPHLKSNQLEDRVMSNNNERKKQEVEEHHRNIKYKWKPKSPIENVNTNVSMPLGNESRTANILEPMTPWCSTLSNTLFSSNSFATCTAKFGNDQIASFLGYGDMGNDLLIGSRGTYLYSITLKDTSTPNPIFLMAKASSSQAWLWHRHLSHLNFDTIYLLSKYDIVTGLPKLKFVKDHLGSSCELGKAKHKTPEVLINFFKLVQRGLHAQVRTVRTNKGMKFLNKTLHAYFAQEEIEHQTSTVRTPEQNGVVERQNRTLVEAAQTMLSAAKFLCSSGLKQLQQHVLLRTVHSDGENLDKMKEKGDACIFVGYSTQSRAYRVYNKRTRVIVETIHVNFDELPHMASDHVSSDPISQLTMSNELDLLFSMMFYELLNGTTLVVSKSSAVNTADALDKRQQQNTTQATTTTVAADTPPLIIQTTPETTNQAPTQAPTVTSIENINQAETQRENAQVKEDEFINIFSTPIQERRETSFRYVDSSNMHTFYQQHPSKHRWTKDHPLEQVVRKKQMARYVCSYSP
ncbi:retrovirus-related pol polyprotein from transposon TNT 1-94 [Tanacetum coccineum]